MLSALFGSVRDFVFRPTVRLQPNFPAGWGKFGLTTVVTFLWFIFGTAILPIGLTLGLSAVAAVAPDAAPAIQQFMLNADGSPTTQFATWMMVVSFIGGFGLASAYIARTMRRAGTSVTEVMALHTRTIAGRNSVTKAVVLFLSALGTFVLWMVTAAVISQFVPAGHQDTVEFAKTLGGWDIVRFALMAAVAAPIFEEIVFRGFLFQGLRTNLRSSLGGCADFTAVILSSAIFSLAHMQFNPTTMLMLFLLGCFHAEVYRRSGSLYASMALHAINNGLQVLILVLTMQ